MNLAAEIAVRGNITGRHVVEARQVEQRPAALGLLDGDFRVEDSF